MTAVDMLDILDVYEAFASVDVPILKVVPSAGRSLTINDRLNIALEARAHYVALTFRDVVSGRTVREFHISTTSTGDWRLRRDRWSDRLSQFATVRECIVDVLRHSKGYPYGPLKIRS